MAVVVDIVGLVDELDIDRTVVAVDQELADEMDNPVHIDLVGLGKVHMADGLLELDIDHVVGVGHMVDDLVAGSQVDGIVVAHH